jgi:AraC-like DNA-binding protein
MGSVKVITILTGLVVGLSCYATATAGPLRLDESLDKIPIGLDVEFLKDESGKLTVAEVAGPVYRNRWFKTKELYPGFGWTRAAIWARFTIVNETNKSLPFFLEHAYPLIDNLQLHAPDLFGADHIIQTGDSHVFSMRPYDARTFVFPLESEARSVKTYYLRQQSTSSMNFPLVVWSPSSFKKWNQLEDRLLMFYYGIILIMILNYLCVYFLIRHLSYLYFVLFISSMLAFVMTQIGSLFQFILPNSPDLVRHCAPLCLSLANIFGCRFVVVFLQLEKHKRLLKTVFDIQTGVFVVALVSVGLSFFVDLHQIVMQATAYLSILTILLAFGAGVYLLLRKERNAYIFASVSLGFLAGCAMYLMKSFGIIQGSFVSMGIIIVGSTLCLLALSLAMVDRINIMRKGLKRLSVNLEREVKTRSIELLLTEVASKVFEDANGEHAAAGGKKYTTSIQNLLDHQRELAIKKLSSDITIISNFNELLDQTIEKVKEISQAENVYLFMQDDGELDEFRSYTESQGAEDTGYSKSIVDSVYASGTYIIAPRGETGTQEGGPSPGGGTVLCVPIQSAGSTVGVCYLEKKSREDFTARDAKMLMNFSDTIITVFENALSYRKTMMRDETKKDHSITIQTEEKIKQAAEYLRNNYLRDISREGLAASLDISPNHLGKFFKIYTGKKINEYISDLRIREAAKRLRENKNENVINIAFSVGFESLSTFNRAFLKIMGITPSEYKDQYK